MLLKNIFSFNENISTNYVNIGQLKYMETENFKGLLSFYESMRTALFSVQQKIGQLQYRMIYCNAYWWIIVKKFFLIHLTIL